MELKRSIQKHLAPIQEMSYKTIFLTLVAPSFSLKIVFVDALLTTLAIICNQSSSDAGLLTQGVAPPLSIASVGREIKGA